MPTKIEWREEIWNPITGCTPISEGCVNCYARRMATRLRGRCGYPTDDPFRVIFHQERMEQPLKWKDPRMVFVCSMGDLFHEDIPGGAIHKIWDVMKACPQHKFLILTKRPKKMKEEVARIYQMERLGAAIGFWAHVWLGVSAENQQRAEERIPVLLQIPAAVRFVSVEPMLGPVDLDIYFPEYDYRPTYNYFRTMYPGRVNKPILIRPGIDWIICGGESGPGARPMHPDWARSLRDQCVDAGVPFFFKQWGEWQAGESKHFCRYPEDVSTGQYMIRVGKKASGRLLDGREWNEMPSVGDPKLCLKRWVFVRRGANTV